MYIRTYYEKIELTKEQEYKFGYAFVYFKDDQIVKVEKADDWFQSTKRVDHIRKTINNNKYDYAITTWFDSYRGFHHGSDKIFPINILEKKYWVRFINNKPCLPRIVNILKINGDNKLIEFRNESEHWGKQTRYYTIEVQINELFENKQDATVFYEGELDKYNKNKINEAIRKYSR